MEYIKKSPALNLSPERAKTENTLPIKKKEIQLFFDTIDNSNDPYTIRDKTLFAVYAYIGVRKNEALILRVRDLDFSEGIIHIQSSKSGKERRRVIIPKKLIKILKTYLKERKENVKNKVENDWLFPGVTGEKHFSSRQAHNRFIKWKKQAGLPDKLTLHSFRAAFAIRLYKTSKDMMLVSKMMGHSAISSTQAYLSYKEDNARETIDKAFQ